MILYQYFSYSTCFEEFLGGHSTSKKSQVQKSPKLILGGQPISIKFKKVQRWFFFFGGGGNPFQKSPNPPRGAGVGGGGGHHHFGPFPKFPRFLLWKASLRFFHFLWDVYLRIIFQRWGLSDWMLVTVSETSLIDWFSNSRETRVPGFPILWLAAQTKPKLCQ